MRGQPGERIPVGRVDVADQAADLLAVAVGPGIDREGVQVRNEVHVRFLDRGEALDRGAVELDLAVERLAELRARQLDVLDHAEDVRELEPHEADVLRLTHLEDLRLGKTRARRVELQDLRLRHAASLFLTMMRDSRFISAERKLKDAI
jgi:hypothetical protein